MPAQSATWDVQADFSVADNPNGVWSYGHYAPGNDPASFLPFTDVITGVLGYEQTAWVLNGDFPRVTKNTGGDRIDGTGWLYAGAVSLHPGRQGEAAVVRWTAPQDFTALYLDTAFMGLDYTTTDVHVALNGAELFAAEIRPFPVTRWGDEERFTPTAFSVDAGDLIDFWVGYLDGDLNNDSTGLRAVLSDQPGQAVEQITPAPYYPFVRVPPPGLPWPRGGGVDPSPVPLPGGLPLMLGGLAALLLARRQATGRPRRS